MGAVAEGEVEVIWKRRKMRMAPLGVCGPLSHGDGSERAGEGTLP